MEKKYLKKVLKGLSIAGLVAGMTGVAMGAASGWNGKKQAAPAPSGWSGTKKGAVSTQVKQEAPAPGYGAEEAKEAAPGYGEEKKDAAPGYGTPAPSGWSGTKKGAVSTQVKQEARAPGYGAEAAKETAPGYGEEKKDVAPGYGTPAPGYGEEKKGKAPGYGK